MSDLYFTQADATPEAWATIERVADEWLGDTPWGQLPLPGWDAGPPPGAAHYVPGARAIPLHLAAGRDLARHILAAAMRCGLATVDRVAGTSPSSLHAALVRWANGAAMLGYSDADMLRAYDTVFPNTLDGDDETTDRGQDIIREMRAVRDAATVEDAAQVLHEAGYGVAVDELALLKEVVAVRALLRGGP